MCRVDGRAREDGKLIERTSDRFAEDNKGTVWTSGRT